MLTLNFKKKKKKEKQELIQKAKEKVVTTDLNELVKKILELMKKHIGKHNKISRRQLFIKVYGQEPELFSELQEFMLWELIKRAMHRCRQRTKAFIVSQLEKQSQYSASDNIGGVWYYWVAEDVSDFHIYRDNINRNIKAMRRMVGRCEKAINEEWHKQEWKYD